MSAILVAINTAENLQLEKFGELLTTSNAEQATAAERAAEVAKQMGVAEPVIGRVATGFGRVKTDAGAAANKVKEMREAIAALKDKTVKVRHETHKYTYHHDRARNRC